MVYVTVMQSPRTHQMTLEEFMYSVDVSPFIITTNETNTRTYEFDQVTNRRLTNIFSIDHLIKVLREFNASTEYLREKNREDLYRTFYIPKKSRGFRRIDAPNEDLMRELRRLKNIMESDFHALYHTSAFAYVRKRCTIDAVRRHQQNESRWFAKFDFSNFFGSTTLRFVMGMLSLVYPFSEVAKRPDGYAELEKAIELAFLDGVLPQGTPLSPLITNVMMIPIDYRLSNAFRDFGGNKMVYTRYADDILVSSRYDFRFMEVQDYINAVLDEFHAPFEIKSEKTRYGSSAGRNFNLGIMLNKDNQMTIGSQKKRQFKCAITAYAKDKTHGIEWPLEDIQRLSGLRNYYRHIEPETIDGIVQFLSEKHGVDVVKAIKNDLKR